MRCQNFQISTPNFRLLPKHGLREGAKRYDIFPSWHRPSELNEFILPTAPHRHCLCKPSILFSALHCYLSVNLPKEQPRMRHEIKTLCDLHDDFLPPLPVSPLVPHVNFVVGVPNVKPPQLTSLSTPVHVLSTKSTRDIGYIN